ncbi:MAG: DNA polymerase/3'-5' exonuclease PolX [Chitinophagaceae bacterium]|nr:DNA polymerase/3'-5' exonuclease PolX [Chitinophagaceae bacterium]
MDNALIADNFSLLSKLMDIHGENAFKTRSYSIAAYHIENLDTPLRDTPHELIPGIRGLSGSIGQKVIEMLDTGKLSVLDELIASTPPGVIEMLHIKGIGPKKIHTIWKEMEIETVGELLYACDENRLTRFKGFGEKTQQNIREGIEYYMQHQGHFLFAEMEVFFPQIDGYLRKLFGENNVAVTGAYRRQDLTLEQLEYIILAPATEVKPKFVSAQPPDLLEDTEHSLLYKLRNGLKLRLYTGETNMAEAQFRHTGSADFIAAFESHYPQALAGSKTEADVFAKAGLPLIPPCLRELPGILDLAKDKPIPDLIQPGDIKGIIHSHSTWSDGSNTLEEMARGCMDKGFEYLVISDHSKAAAYAKGLSEERIRQQHEEIDRLNQQLAPFRIFKSIECDILNDGSLDYTDDVLASFDLVIASVHSNLKMTEEKAMMRLIKAVSHPAVTILGHPTGRLLLSRRGYPVDHRMLIDACAAHGVVLEINAHPRRLDLDWQWIPYALEKNVLLSINPDAHSIEGFEDIRYGVLAAQKGGLEKRFNLSSKSLVEFEAFLKKV